MKWILKNGEGYIHHWQIETEEPVASVKYSEKSHSVRIDAQVRRLFFFEDTGVFIRKRLIKTEYGVVIGECYSKDKNTGYIFIDKKRIFYSLKNNRLVLYRGNTKLAKATIDTFQQIDDYEISAIGFAFLWMCESGIVQKALAEPELVM